MMISRPFSNPPFSVASASSRGCLFPATKEENYAQVEQLIAAESPEILSQLKNIHTLFYIPMQWFAIGAGVMMFCGFLSMVFR